SNSGHRPRRAAAGSVPPLPWRSPEGYRGDVKSSPMNATPRPGTSADVTGSTAAADLEDVRRRKNRPGVANPFSAELKHRDADCEVSMPTSLPTHIECIDPILRVEDMGVSVRYYVDVLGFEEAPWGTDDFTHVMLGGRGIYLCKGGQGHVGAWV